MCNSLETHSECAPTGVNSASEARPATTLGHSGATTIWVPARGKASSDYQANQISEAAAGGTVDAGPHFHRNRVTTSETIGMHPDKPSEDLTDLGY
jgi:hypothetical protein